MPDRITPSLSGAASPGASQTGAAVALSVAARRLHERAAPSGRPPRCASTPSARGRPVRRVSPVVAARRNIHAGA